MARPHTSASQLSCYASMCPRLYAYRYIDERPPEKTGVQLPLGSAVHSAIALWFEERASGSDLTIDDVVEVVHADFDAGLHSKNIDYGKIDRGVAHVQAEALVRVFLESYGELRVVESEKRFEVDLVHPETGETSTRPFIGYLDHVLSDGTILELKTLARKISSGAAETNLQYSAYKMVGRRLQAPDFKVVAMLKKKVPDTQELSLGVASESEEAWFMAAACDIEAAIGAGVFPPAPGVSCGFCEYRSACRGVS